MSARLDRIEKGIEDLLAGIVELRASQSQTDAQIKALRESQNQTDAMQKETTAQINALRESQNQTDAMQRETDAQIKALRESQNQTDEQMRDTDRKIKTLERLYGDLGIVQGEVAEELFYRNVISVFRQADLHIGQVRRNVKVKGLGEYDIVADNANQVLVIEVKNKLSKRMVEEFMNKKLPRFKSLLPKYSEYDVLGGIGALVVKDDVGRFAEKAGLFVLTQNADGGASLLNRKGFKPRVFA